MNPVRDNHSIISMDMNISHKKVEFTLNCLCTVARGDLSLTG